jgi:hypothetical protein
VDRASEVRFGRPSCTSLQCNRDAIAGCRRTSCAAQSLSTGNSYASTYRHLRVSVSDRQLFSVLYKTCPSPALAIVGGTSDLTMTADGNFPVPFTTLVDYDLTFGGPPRLLRMVGAKLNIFRGGPLAARTNSYEIRESTSTVKMINLGVVQPWRRRGCR